jgi:hypothetical protein
MTKIICFAEIKILVRMRDVMGSSLLKGNIEVHESSKYNPEFGLPHEYQVR